MGARSQQIHPQLNKPRSNVRLKKAEDMKTMIILLLSCASVLATDSDIRVLTTSGTNSQRAIGYRRDVFTRDGQTNLVTTTSFTPRGVIRINRFYHAGQLVGNFVALPQETSFDTEAGPFCMSLKYGAAGEIRSAWIGDKRGIPLDEFTYRDGVFTPVEGPVKVNRLMKPKIASETEFDKKAAEAERKRAADEGGPTSQ